MAGQLTVGAFVAFSSLTAMAYAAILRTLGIWDQWQLIAVLLNRLNDIFEPEPEQGRDRSRLIPVHSFEGHIELRGVGFKYGGPEAPDILKRHQPRVCSRQDRRDRRPQRQREDDARQAARWSTSSRPQGRSSSTGVDLKDAQLS